MAYIFLYNVELFPSNVRGFTMGIMIFLFNMISTSIPFMGILTDKLHLHFMTCLLPYGLIAFIGSFKLPETFNKTLEN